MSEPTMRREIVLGAGQEIVVRTAGQVGGASLVAVLDEIRAMGHTYISLTRTPANGRWTCTSSNGGTAKEEGEPIEHWSARVESGTGVGDSAIEAATDRLEMVRRLVAERKESP